MASLNWVLDGKLYGGKLDGGILRKQTAAVTLSKEVAIKKEPDITFQVNDESGKCDETSGQKK